LTYFNDKDAMQFVNLAVLKLCSMIWLGLGLTSRLG